MQHPPPVRSEKNGPVTTIVLSRSERKNAIDRSTAEQLATAFECFDQDDSSSVAVLWGEGATFCAGADLKAIAEGVPNHLDLEGHAPLGPSRLRLHKPTIAAIAGYAVAGGLELALFCDLRIAEQDAVLGVFCRRFGVPLIDGGTVRLPRLIGHGRALDLILTGRPVSADEALLIGLVNRVVPSGQARVAAEALALQLASFPQRCLQTDRLSVYEQWDLPFDQAMRNEFVRGLEVLQQESIAGASRFVFGEGRHGSPL